MRPALLSRVVTVVFVLVMALLATWLVLFDSLGPYVCAALLAAMTLALAAVRPDRRWLYAIGVVVGVAAMVMALWPTDGGGYCGSVPRSLTIQAGVPMGTSTPVTTGQPFTECSSWSGAKCPG